MIEHRIAGNAHHPGQPFPLRCIRSAFLLHSADSAKECFLKQIVRQIPITYHTHHIPEYALLMSFHQLAERLLIVVFNVCDRKGLIRTMHSE